MNFATYDEIFHFNYPEYKTRMEKLHALYYPQENKLSENQIGALKEILENAQVITNAIAPLKDIGINLELGIVGGAVRDIALNRTDMINDYDFVVRLSDSYKQLVDIQNQVEPSMLKNILTHEESQLFYSQFNSMKEYCIENQFKKELADPYFIPKDSTIETNTKIKLLVQILVERQLKTNKYSYSLFRNKDVQNKYLNQHIDAIFQIDNIGNKKIDLILSKYNAQGFAMTFDFEICKASINLQFLMDEKINDKDNLKNVIDRIVLTPGMLKDIHDKTFTIRVDNFDENHIHYFMNKHFLKLKDKFPEYSLNSFSRSSEPESISKTNLVNYYKAQHAYKDLQIELGTNDNKLQIGKIKI